MSEPIVDLIVKKRDGGQLSPEQWQHFIAGVTEQRWAPEQISAFLMAVFLRGASTAETQALTEAMVASGTRYDLAQLVSDHGWRGLADKHSTGGVGDKITLILTPLLASYGIAVPQLSGRGLGHTGGTLDKLEAFAGFQARLDDDAYRQQLAQVGAVICAAGQQLAPADATLYALRDVTGTVESIPLIAASIMSKKIAEGTQALMLDVKVGSGAFMKTPAAAEELARLMIRLGQGCNVHTEALMTRMSTPLGAAVGNRVEAVEALEVLAGGGPADVRELTLALAQPLLRHFGVDAEAGENLDNGRALEVFEALLNAQNSSVEQLVPEARHYQTATAPASGVVTSVDALAVGRASWLLGAGRTRPEEAVDLSAGIVLAVRPGDQVRSTDVLAHCYSAEPQRFDAAQRALLAGITIAAESDPAADTAAASAAGSEHAAGAETGDEPLVLKHLRPEC